jgi:hypothetical protein
MKTIRITLVKEGARATCTHLYRNADWPDETTWCGDRKAFTTPDGTLPNFRDGLHQLEDTVAFQASLCGAAHTIEDLGGLAHGWGDEVVFPSGDAMADADDGVVSAGDAAAPDVSPVHHQLTSG